MASLPANYDFTSHNHSNRFLPNLCPNGSKKGCVQLLRMAGADENSSWKILVKPDVGLTVLLNF